MWNHWDNHDERTNNRVEGDNNKMKNFCGAADPNIDKAAGLLQMYELDARDKYLNAKLNANYENILPRIRQNLTIINEEPVYHTLQSRVQLIPQQPGQEFCQQYSQDPPEPSSQITTSLASSNAASSTSIASTGSVDICFMCNKSFQKSELKRHQFYCKKSYNKDTN
jgi:hypothetical protein